METFANYILSEEDFSKKMQIVYYLQKREKIFFDNSVVLKAELARLFIDTMKLKVDRNVVLTACLLYGVKKDKIAHDLEAVKKYAQNGAEYLETLGFSEKFCKICSQVNRYGGEENREKESDILELVDNFGGLVLDRPERKGYSMDEAINLIEHRILRGKNNIYFEKFKEFIYLKEGVAI